jgi:hypothetical protein
VADGPGQYDRKVPPSSSTSLIGSDDAAAAVDCITSSIANPGHVQQEGTVMRAHPVVAVATLILVGVKLTFFSTPIAAADVGSTKSVGIDVSGMHHEIKSLPVENFHDMTFVFPVAIDRTI